MARAAVSWIFAGVLGVAVDAAQQPRPTFEVASVRMQPGPLQLPYRGIVALPGGIFDAGQATVETLLMFALDVKPFSSRAGPSG